MSYHDPASIPGLGDRPGPDDVPDATEEDSIRAHYNRNDTEYQSCLDCLTDALVNAIDDVGRGSEYTARLREITVDLEVFIKEYSE